MQDGASEDTENEDGEEGGGLNLEVVRSYLSFAREALRKRKLLMGIIVVCGLALAITVAKLIPRTYVCATTLMTVQNAVLDSERGSRPLAGAEGLLLSHENLENLIQETNLKKTFYARRPPLLRFKDKIVASLLGPMDDRMLSSALVGTLETRLAVSVKEDTLTLEASWTDSKTAKELAYAMQQGFLRLRHKAEISAFHEKMAILNQHASQLRQEIETLAGQVDADLKEKAKARLASKKLTGKSTEASPVRLVETREAITDEQLPGLIQRVNDLKQRLANADNERNSRVREEQAKLDEMKVRLTPEHPQVIAQQARVGIASQVPSEISLMRTEVTDLESQIRQRQAMVKTGKLTFRQVGGGTPSADAAAGDGISMELLGLMRDKDADPALSAQMSGAVVRYASLRDDVRGAKLALDTAQAAFNHRYQVVIPVDEPTKPTKPKVAVIIAAGVVLSLLVALVVPILLALRRDLIVERWQVHRLQLPVLAELRLPDARRD